MHCRNLLYIWNAKSIHGGTLEDPLEGLGWGKKVACIAVKMSAQAPFFLFNAHDRLYIFDTTFMKHEDI